MFSGTDSKRTEALVSRIDVYVCMIRERVRHPRGVASGGNGISIVARISEIRRDVYGARNGAFVVPIRAR